MARFVVSFVSFVMVSMIALALEPARASAQDGAPDALADPEAQASALEGRLRELSRGTQALRASVGESHRRLAAIEMSLFERVDGARLTITHRDRVGPFYRLIEATYAIDGEPVFHRRDERGVLGATRELDVHDGILRPGDHTLSVVLRYVGDGGEVIRYLEGYRFSVRSSHAFVAPAGQHTRLELQAFERGFPAPYEHRLEVGFSRTVVPWR